MADQRDKGQKHGQQTQQPQQQQSGNFGQKEADKQKQSEAELKQMGEGSQQSGKG
ncbi:MAG TPA: hypothetical protein VGD36_06885 [Xanthobacteraceae bacterium]|jgi:hypothetical protein